MKDIRSAEQILFKSLTQLSTKNKYENLEVIKVINEAVISAMHQHTSQYLLPIQKFLINFHSASHESLHTTMEEMAIICGTISDYLYHSEKEYIVKF